MLASPKKESMLRPGGSLGDMELDSYELDGGRDGRLTGGNGLMLAVDRFNVFTWPRAA